MLLREFPVVRLLSDLPPHRPDVGFSDAQDVFLMELADFAATVDKPMLVIEPEVIPHKGAEVLDLDQVLYDSGQPIGFPSVCRISGMYTSRGITLVHPGQWASRALSVVVPHTIGMLAGYETPQKAFATAFDVMSNARQELSIGSRDYLAVGLSMGADRANGDWWRLGGLSGFIGDQTMTEAWAQNAALVNDNFECKRRIAGLARHVRLSCDVPVQVFGPEQSRAVRQILSDFAPAFMWTDFVAACKDIGPEAADMARRYDATTKQVWPGRTG